MVQASANALQAGLDWLHQCFMSSLCINSKGPSSMCVHMETHGARCCAGLGSVPEHAAVAAAARPPGQRQWSGAWPPAAAQPQVGRRRQRRAHLTGHCKWH